MPMPLRDRLESTDWASEASASAAAKGLSACLPKPTCPSLSPLESESDVSLYVQLAVSTSVEARLLFFRGLQESEISLAP